MLLTWQNTGGSAVQISPLSFPEILDYWAADSGITQADATERVSGWAPLKGSDSLAQATAANQPILLPYSGTNYLWLPKVNGNYAATPDSVPLSITGDIDIRMRVSMDDWTPAAIQAPMSKYGATKSWIVYVNTNGTIGWQFSPDGTADVQKASTAAPVVSNFAAIWLRVTMDVDNGAGGYDVKYWTAADQADIPAAASFTQLGATVTTATATQIFDSGAAVCVSNYGNPNDGAYPFGGKVYRTAIYNGIDGTKVFDANFTQVAEGSSTFTESSSNAATVTINSTGAKPAQVVGSQQVLFDGTAFTLSTGAITLNQPISLVLVGKQITWTGNDLIVDGNTANTLGLKQTTGTPKVSINAGAAVAENANWTLNANACVGLVLNGASSQLQVNLGTATTGDAGAGNPSGLFVGSNATPAAFGNFQTKAIALCASALSQARLNQLIRAMAAQYGIAV